MTKNDDKELENEEMVWDYPENNDEIIDDLNELEDEIEKIEENEENNSIDDSEWHLDKTKDILSRTLADFENYKMRVERDKQDMIFFLKSDILKKVLPRIDDMERIIKNTPESEQAWALYEWVVAMEKKLKDDLEKMWVISFNSLWEEVNPDLHEVMTQIPGWVAGKIVDEFEKGYKIWDKVLRVAKVVVSAWE